MSIATATQSFAQFQAEYTTYQAASIGFDIYNQQGQDVEVTEGKLLYCRACGPDHFTYTYSSGDDLYQVTIPRKDMAIISPCGMYGWGRLNRAGFEIPTIGETEAQTEAPTAPVARAAIKTTRSQSGCLVITNTETGEKVIITKGINDCRPYHVRGLPCPVSAATGKRYNPYKYKLQREAKAAVIAFFTKTGQFAPV